MTAILPPPYALSSSGSKAGSRANSEPSTSAHSSAWPSTVTTPGLYSASNWISVFNLQLPSDSFPWSPCEIAGLIAEERKTVARRRRRSMAGEELARKWIGEEWESMLELRFKRKRDVGTLTLVGYYDSDLLGVRIAVRAALRG